MKNPLLILALCFLLLSVTAHAQNSDTDVEFVDTTYIGEQFVTSVSNTGDDRLYVSGRNGITYIYEDGNLLPTPFLDLTSIVYTEWEGGFYRLVFHPEYAKNGYFYVHYTYNHPTDELTSRVSRFSVNAQNPNVADVDSETILLELDQLYQYHSAGDMQFYDGYLHIAFGDSQVAAESQNTGSLYGSILRIDVDGNGVAGNCGDVINYTVPADNPFVNDEEACNAVWMYGMRNPWRFDIDPVTGDLWVGDVGDADWEEVHYAPAGSSGLNFGWPCWDGNVEMSNKCRINNHTPPVHIEPHQQEKFHCSITGGMVYRGSQMPQYSGDYVIADWCAGDFKFLSMDDGVLSTTDLPNLTGGPVSFGRDAQGELYAGFNGYLKKLTTTNPVPVTPTPQPSGQDINCDGRWNLIDALLVKQYDLSAISTADQCSGVGANQRIYLPACDINGDDQCGLIDAVIIQQCNALVANPFCKNL